MASRFAIEPDYETDNALSLNDRELADDIDRAIEADTARHIEAEISFWQAVNNLSIEYPEFSIVVIPEVTEQ